MTRIAVIGLGYVGLPVAAAFAEKHPGTIGFDIDTRRVAALAGGADATGEVGAARLKSCGLAVTSELGKLKGCDTFIVCVPTPIHKDRRPNLEPLRAASESVGQVMKKGALVIFESTVYPGVTEEFCGPILARVSGLKQGKDFRLGYSPERINPGDKEHGFERILKVVAGEDEKTAGKVARLYGSVVKAGIHRAPSIKVAEAAKALENTQRDLNIALMNEMAIICDALQISTRDVLDAAATKWNFLRFSPGLVGGHCIGVDPYYLTSKAQELGYNPQVILAGRRINDAMGNIIARRVVRFLATGSRPIRQARVGVLGLTFKENVPDIRNSRVPDILAELKTFGIAPLAHDPLASPKDVAHEYGFQVAALPKFRDLDALILAVPHARYLEKPSRMMAMLRKGGILIDIKSAIDRETVPGNLRYWESVSESMATILVTGTAGFIGAAVAHALLARGDAVIGIDNLNDYYDVALKQARLDRLKAHANFTFRKLDVADREGVLKLAGNFPGIHGVVHLAAQAGVRYSLIDPYAYVTSNVMGQVVMLELARKLKNLKHFVYASWSSVYGGNTKLPFSVEDPVEQPNSLYAATKRTDELFGHTYAHLYGIPSTGLRFFTVYGPWGRPDMAAFIFTKAIIAGEPIKVFNRGEMWRDFTYIDDIVNGVVRALEHVPAGTPPHAVYNLGNHKSEKLTDFIGLIETALQRKVKMQFEPMQPGDVAATYADIETSRRDLGFEPATPIAAGVPKFVDWYKDYYGV